MTTKHPAHGPVSLDRLHQISEILSKIECDICGHLSTDPEGWHYCCEDNSND